MEFNESTANEIRSIIKMFINFNAAIKTVGHFQKEIVENLNNFTCCKTLRLMQFCHFFCRFFLDKKISQMIRQRENGCRGA